MASYAQAQAEDIGRRLCDGAAMLGLELDARQLAQLQAYLELIAKWNKVYNLTAVRDKSEMVTHHLLDSLAVVPLLHGKRVLDVGSGAGLPGIVLAIARPELEVVTIDKVHKKIAFQTQAAAELGLGNLSALGQRVEDLQGQVFDTIVSRAFSSLSDFIALTRPLLAVDGEWAAMKGVYPRDEIESLPADVEVGEAVKIRVPGLDAERHLVRCIPKRKDV